jgi:hypothetical protein
MQFVFNKLREYHFISQPAPTLENRLQHHLLSRDELADARLRASVERGSASCMAEAPRACQELYASQCDFLGLPIV